MQSSTGAVREIWETSRAAFGEAIPNFSPADQLVVEEGRHRLKLTYVSPRTSPDPNDITRIELCFHFDSREMWISSLTVATRLRLGGVGSRLVKVAETIARATGVQNISVFPLARARSFWKKMGYAPHLRAARVLCKELNPSSRTRTDVTSMAPGQCATATELSDP